jgi:hypothetical protein
MVWISVSIFLVVSYLIYNSHLNKKFNEKQKKQEFLKDKYESKSLVRNDSLLRSALELERNQSIEVDFSQKQIWIESSQIDGLISEKLYSFIKNESTGKFEYSLLKLSSTDYSKTDFTIKNSKFDKDKENSILDDVKLLITGKESDRFLGFSYLSDWGIDIDKIKEIKDLNSAFDLAQNQLEKYVEDVIIRYNPFYSSFDNQLEYMFNEYKKAQILFSRIEKDL